MKKTFWVLVLINLILIMYFITRCYFSWSSNSEPASLVSNMNNNIHKLKLFNLFSNILLLIISNSIGYKLKQAYLVYVPFVLFSLGIVFAFYFAEQLFIYRKQNNMWEGGFSLNLFIGISQSLLAFVLLSVNFGILKKMIDKQQQKITDTTGV